MFVQGVDLLPPDGWLEDLASVEARPTVVSSPPVAARPHRGVHEPRRPHCPEFDLCAQQPLDQRLARREPAGRPHRRAPAVVLPRPAPGIFMVRPAARRCASLRDRGFMSPHPLPAPNAYFRSARCSDIDLRQVRSKIRHQNQHRRRFRNSVPQARPGGRAETPGDSLEAVSPARSGRTTHILQRHPWTRTFATSSSHRPTRALRSSSGRNRGRSSSFVPHVADGAFDLRPFVCASGHGRQVRIPKPQWSLKPRELRFATTHPPARPPASAACTAPPSSGRYATPPEPRPKTGNDSLDSADHGHPRLALS